MDLLPRLTLDAIALVWFIVLAGGYRLICGLPAVERRSIVGAVQQQRVTWMRTMASRDNRVLDAVLLQGLSQGNAFFASTSAIAIGGLAASMGAGEAVRVFLARLPFAARTDAVLFEIKVLFLISIFVYAFFKFAWAFRLSHYTGILIGATPAPGDPDADARARHAERTARLIGIAAEHANNGLRAFYYAIAALTWFFHPLLFMAATAVVQIVLIRRDFFSRSRRVLAECGT